MFDTSWFFCRSLQVDIMYERQKESIFKNTLSAEVKELLLLDFVGGRKKVMTPTGADLTPSSSTTRIG